MQWGQHNLWLTWSCEIKSCQIISILSLDTSFDWIKCDPIGMFVDDINWSCSYENSNVALVDAIL